MNLITKVLRAKTSSLALIPFITAGYPDLSTCIQALHALDQKGADVIELGLPYSDPLADGPVIQEASRIALDQGTYFNQVLYILNIATTLIKAPVIIFTYYNPILSKGVSQFIKAISQAGARGLIIPDLPLEEVDDLIKICSFFEVELILFISPTSSQFRIKSILAKSPGCIYLLSSCGVTGIRQSIDFKTSQLANYIKAETDKMVVVGFGVSTLVQVSNMMNWDIDGIVIGSAFMKTMISKSSKNSINSLSVFCEQVRSTLDAEVFEGCL